MTVEELAAPNGRPIVSGPFGSNISSRFFVDRGIPVIRGSNLTTGMERFVENAFVYVTEEKATELGNVDAIDGDLIFTAAGSLGQVGIIPSNSNYPKYIISNKQLRARLDTSIIEPLFAYYWLASKPMVTYIQQQNTGSSVPLINLSILKRLKVPVPSLDVQRAILEILGALDAKIELNRRMNETLESLARSLFKSWFVDFDPVRAKMDGRPPPGLPPATAALFPDSFEHENGDLIPMGWSVGPILQQADLLSGGTPKTSVAEYWGGEIPWASAKDVSQCGEAFLIRTGRTITKAGLDKSATKIIEPFTTVIVARGATTGRLAMFGEAIAMNQTCYALRSKHDTHLFLYCHARDFIDKLVYSAHGSVFDTITTRTFETTPVLLPAPCVAQAFEETVTPIYSQLRANLRESETLAALRDTLLPRLLSGELRVADCHT